MKFQELEINFSDGRVITIIANMHVGEIEAAAINWSFRTNKFTAKSLCDYINSKGLHKAYTVAQWNQLNTKKKH